MRTKLSQHPQRLGWSMRIRKQTLVVLLAVCVGALLVVLYFLYQLVVKKGGASFLRFETAPLDQYPLRSAGKIAYYTYLEDFHPINERGVYSFRNVCIEAITGDPVQVPLRSTNGSFVYYNETKRIVVYDSFFRTGLQSLVTSASINTQMHRWDVFFSRDAIPDTHTYLNDTAFFISQSCPGNFHHFWNDEFLMLFSVMNMTNRLRPSSRNHVMYRKAWNVVKGDENCDDIQRYAFFLETLHVDKNHDAFFQMPDRVCFRNAVFGLANLNHDSRQAVKYVLQAAGINQKMCQTSDRVTIIQRHNRRILNVNELMDAAQEQGFQDIQLVVLEELPVQEQLHIIACSTVLVGVQGAGLQWSIFMPAGSTLIEIAWPQKHWGFYFSNWVTPYGIDHKKLIANHVHVNWPVYEKLLRSGQRVPPEEREDMLKAPPRSATLDSIWKWADVVVDKNEFSNVLETTKVPQLLAISLPPVDS